MSIRRRAAQARRDLEEALRRYEPRVRRAFVLAVAQVRRRIPMRRLIQAIRGGDLAGAVDLVEGARLGDALRGSGLEPGQSNLVDELTGALRAGGAAGAKQLGVRAARAMPSLNMTSPGAIRYLQETLPAMIREIDEATREGVRAAVARGFQDGRPAAVIARDVRNLVGLTEYQAGAVENLREQLLTGELGSGTAPWARRLDAISRQRARRLFAQEKPDLGEVESLVDRYRQSLVNLRGKTIARTEVNRSFSEGQRAMWGQAAGEGWLDPEETRRQWLYTPDDRVRDEHASVPSMNPGGVPLDGFYQTPVGPVTGPRNGGPASFQVSCRCTEVLLFSDD